MAEQPRDASGKYIKKDTPISQTINVEVKSSSTVDSLKVNKDEMIEKPVLSLQVNNPFKKLLYWLKDVRKKQTTTFDFKIKIPLIALPIFLIVLGAAFQFFFNLGKNNNNEQLILITPTPIVTTTTALPVEKIMSRYGVIKATYQVGNLLKKAALLDNPNSSESSTEETPTPTEAPPSRYVLLEKNDKITFLLTTPEIVLSKYINSEVIITGTYNMEKSTLAITKESDIEIIR
jgi:hypothetical protein